MWHRLPHRRNQGERGIGGIELEGLYFPAGPSPAKQEPREKRREGVHGV